MAKTPITTFAHNSLEPYNGTSQKFLDARLAEQIGSVIEAKPELSGIIEGMFAPDLMDPDAVVAQYYADSERGNLSSFYATVFVVAGMSELFSNSFPGAVYPPSLEQLFNADQNVKICIAVTSEGSLKFFTPNGNEVNIDDSSIIKCVRNNVNGLAQVSAIDLPGLSFGVQGIKSECQVRSMQFGLTLQDTIWAETEPYFPGISADEGCVPVPFYVDTEFLRNNPSVGSTSYTTCTVKGPFIEICGDGEVLIDPSIDEVFIAVKGFVLEPAVASMSASAVSKDETGSTVVGLSLVTGNVLSLKDCSGRLITISKTDSTDSICINRVNNKLTITNNTETLFDVRIYV